MNIQKAIFLSGIVTLSSISTILADETPKLHPLEAACIDYEMTGQMMNGTTTRCHRNYAYEQYEIQDAKVGFGNFTQSQKQHNITIGDTIYAIDLSSNKGTKTKNPMYDSIASSLENQSAEEMGAAFVSAMGFTPTDAEKTIADTVCKVYNAQQMGTVCLTDDGLMLEQSFMGNITTATNVVVGDGGADANYTLYQNVTITDGPDLSNGFNLQDLMNQAGQQ